MTMSSVWRLLSAMRGERYARLNNHKIYEKIRLRHA